MLIENPSNRFGFHGNFNVIYLKNGFLKIFLNSTNDIKFDCGVKAYLKDEGIFLILNDEDSITKRHILKIKYEINDESHFLETIDSCFKPKKVNYEEYIECIINGKREGFYRKIQYYPDKREISCSLKDGKTIDGSTIIIRKGNTLNERITRGKNF